MGIDDKAAGGEEVDPRRRRSEAERWLALVLRAVHLGVSPPQP